MLSKVAARGFPSKAAMWPANCPAIASPKAKWDLAHQDWGNKRAEGGPDEGAVLFERGEAAQRSHDYEAAVIWWTRAIEEMAARTLVTRPLESHPLYWTTLRALKECYEQLGRQQDAIECYTKLIGKRTTPEAYGDCVALGECYITVADFQGAINTFERALMIAREVGDATPQSWLLGKIGLCLQKTRNYRQALEHLQHSLQLSRDTELFERLRGVGECHQALGMYRGAIEYLQQAVQQCESGENPVDEAEVWCRMQQCYQMLDDKQQAAWTADAAAGARLAAAGVVHFGQREFHLAIQRLREAAVVRRRLGQLRAEATALAQGALCQLEIGEHWEGIKWLERAREQFVAANDKAGQQRCWAIMAECYKREEEWRVAARHWRVALRMSSEGCASRTGYIQNLAYCYTQLKEYSDALGYYAKLAEAGNDESSQWEQMAECHVALNQHRAAIGCYKRALNTAGDPSETSRVHKQALAYKTFKRATPTAEEQAATLREMIPHVRTATFSEMAPADRVAVLMAMPEMERADALSNMSAADRDSAVMAMTPADLVDFQQGVGAWSSAVQASEQSEREWAEKLQNELLHKRLMAMSATDRALALAVMSKEQSDKALAGMSAAERAETSTAMLENHKLERKENEERVAKMMEEMSGWRDAVNEHQAANDGQEKAFLAVAAEKERIEKEAQEQAQHLAATNAKLAALMGQKEQIESQLANQPKGLQKKDKPSWEEDDNVSNCSDCGLEFTAIRRRHHCRGCGGIFCDDCSDKKLYCLPWARNQESRVCNSCFAGAFFVPRQQQSGKGKGKGKRGRRESDVLSPDATASSWFQGENLADDTHSDDTFVEIFDTSPITGQPEMPSERKEWFSRAGDPHLAEKSALRSLKANEPQANTTPGELVANKSLTSTEQQLDYIDQILQAQTELQQPAIEISEEDVRVLVTIGVDEAKARATLSECGGNVDLAMDKALA